MTKSVIITRMGNGQVVARGLTKEHEEELLRLIRQRFRGLLESTFTPKLRSYCVQSVEILELFPFIKQYCEEKGYFVPDAEDRL